MMKKKYSDDYSAKLEIWAREGKVYALPTLKNIPEFTPQKFNSYEEMNAWKHDLVMQFASNGGARWTT